MHSIFWYIYVQPLYRIVFCILMLVLLWAWLGRRYRCRRVWRIFNGLALAGSLIAIVYLTLYNRDTAGDAAAQLILIPFHSFQEAKIQPEMYRVLLMNVFLFVPLGLSLPNVLPRKWRSAGSVTAAILLGLCLSAAIEFLQYRCSLGRCEADDVIMNTLGTAIGALSYVLRFPGGIGARLHSRKNGKP